MQNQEQQTPNKDFWAGTEIAARMVNNWPEWKRDLYKQETVSDVEEQSKTSEQQKTDKQ